MSNFNLANGNEKTNKQKCKSYSVFFRNFLPVSVLCLNSLSKCIAFMWDAGSAMDEIKEIKN